MLLAAARASQENYKKPEIEAIFFCSYSLAPSTGKGETFTGTSSNIPGGQWRVDLELDLTDADTNDKILCY